MAYYDTGDAPVSIAKGDFNGDELTDLAVVTRKSNAVSILLRDGTCSGDDCIYLDAASYPVGNTPVAAATGRFNADENLDLAVANSVSDNVTILLGNGDGTFQTAVHYAAGDKPSGIAAGDVNEDGRLDLVVPNQDSNNMSILLGNADGSFQAPVHHDAGVKPSGVVLSSFNAEDTHLDIAVSNKGDKTVSIFLGNGDGTFADSDGDGTLDANDGCPGDPLKIAAGTCGCGLADIDSDDDGTLDCIDECPFDAAKTSTGECGCGLAETDSDNDGTLDCNDDCPFDAAKTSAGECGCGLADIDSDNDGTLDCNDACPIDVNKTAPGECGCGISDTHSDDDGIPDCIDACPDNTDKTAPGICGCDVAEGCNDTCNDQVDSDNDGTNDCDDLCPRNAPKIDPGTCGCGIPDTDSDSDGTPNCNDACPNDGNKTSPGICGCGNTEDCAADCAGDIDGDGVNDCLDNCPLDNGKTDPGDCGCGIADTDTDDDGTPDCSDACPDNIDKTTPGTCGCDLAEGCNDTCSDQDDSDGDGTNDCDDLCPQDGLKTDPGDCGCGISDTDSDGDTTPDCMDACPNDEKKTSPGISGCGISDTDDSDGDGTPDAIDGCPDDPNKINPGACGCGILDTDTDGDKTPDCYDSCDDSQNTDGDAASDCVDLCDTDDGKVVPGVCGCNIADTDTDGDNTPDCLDNCPDDPNKVFPGIKGCGTPDPEFSSYPAGVTPGAAAAADFDKDGQTDLAVANRSTGTVSILLGKGDGAFETPVPYEAAEIATAIIVDDFNQDGHPDMAVTKSESFNISVLLGNGDGSFQTAMYYGSGDNPSAITSDDIDQDGFSDLIVANQGSDRITLILTKTEVVTDESKSPDGTLAKEVFFGNRTGLPGPLKIETTGTSPDKHSPLAPGPEDTEATLWLTVDDNVRVDTAWVEIRPPETTLEANPAVPAVDLPRIDLSWDNVAHRYESTYSEFVDSGRYRLHFFVQDTDGKISLVAAPDSYSSTSSGFTNTYQDALDYDEESLYARYVYKDKEGNQAPEFHSFINIKNGEDIDTGRGFMLAWSAAVDPEKYKVTYIIVVKNKSGAVLFRQDGISGTHFLLPSSLFEGRSNDEILFEIYARDNYGLQSVLNEKMTASAIIGTGTALDGLFKGHVYNAHKLEWPIEQGKIIINNDRTYDIYEDGYFSIPLPVATYQAHVVVAGYIPATHYGIKIVEGGITTYNIDLIPEDKDGDNVPDIEDLFPDDPNEWEDTDGDGEGNNADPDDDNDNMEDEWEEAYGLDPEDNKDATEDADGDGLSNRDEHELGTDPTDDSDPCSALIKDSDGDCVPDDKDAFDDDPTEWLDTDNDNIGNNKDFDDDGDGMPDQWEEDNDLNPLDPDDADDDPDNDGYTNLEEFLNETNPKNTPPLQPRIISPVDGETNVSLTPQLKTQPFQDQDYQDKHSASQWQVGTDPDVVDDIIYDVTSTQNLTFITLPAFLLDAGQAYYWRVRFYDSSNEASEWSEIRSFAVAKGSEGDNNNNGIPDDQEIDDNDLDLDDNGVPDIEQEDMRCVRFGWNEMVLCLQVPEDVMAVDSLKWIDPNTIADWDNRPLTLPFGLISFKLAVHPGAETDVTLFLSEAIPSDTEWYKYDLIDGWYTYTDYAWINQSRTSVSLRLKDGDFGDGDGTENGIILDPSGPGSNPAVIYSNYSGLGDDSLFCFVKTTKVSFPRGFVTIAFLFLAGLSVLVLCRRWLR
jgi:hypothetical protein